MPGALLEPASLRRCRKCRTVVTITVVPFDPDEEFEPLSGYTCPYCDNLNIGRFGGHAVAVLDDWMQVDATSVH